MHRGAAVFDFDRTLVRQETMAMFLRALAGGGRHAAACCAAAAKAGFARPSDRMRVFRKELLRRLLADKTIHQARAAAEMTYARLEWNLPITEELARHRDAGRRLLVATGSLSIYMPVFLELGGQPVDGLLSTEIEIDGDVMTGEMKTASCTWIEKARRVRDWLSNVEGPVWGYGNLPHDGAMLELADHPTAVPV